MLDQIHCLDPKLRLFSKLYLAVTMFSYFLSNLITKYLGKDIC